jgi:uncharacterized repeat protein (TIGR03803 family)
MALTRLGAAAALVAGVMSLPLAGHAATLTTLYSFQGGADGSGPEDGLTYLDGFFYGVTTYGGTSSAPECANMGCGTIFKIDATTGAETVLYAFDHSTGQSPTLGGVIFNHGKLYGTAHAGGASGYGTVFEFDPVTGKAKLLHSFSGGADGQYPAAGLTYANGNFYGTTVNGGSAGSGTIFEINATTGAETVVHSFTGPDGVGPEGGLIFVGDSLYGTTELGDDDNGTVFAFNPTTDAETVLYKFGRAPDASEPSATLLYESGNLFGTSMYGGAANGMGPGTIFKVNATTGAETVLYHFDKAHGDTPVAGLIDRGGNLYGTTAAGGPNGQGSVFRLNSTTDRLTVLQSFTSENGAQPEGGLIYHAGSFYGATSTGGTAGAGTVFKLVP